MNRQTISSEQRWEGTDCVPRLTVFTFLWACQALVHQEFYSSWLHEDNPLGWALTSVALATLLWPKVLGLFIAMLATSIVYNVVKWPFVVNHILLESGINGTILLAIVLQLARRETRYGSREFRDQVFDAFAPVIRFMLVVMYYFAILSKLNWDFLDPEVSAVSAMYVDLLRRIPVLPTSLGAKSLAIVLTLIIEAAIPILLTFRRTRYAALAIGLPFHFMLGLIGHRTFSALAFALYSLYCIEPLSVVISQYYETWKQRWGLLRLQRATKLARLGVVGSVLLLVAADYTGHFRDGLGWARIYRIPWLIWGCWSFGVACAYLMAMRQKVADPPRQVTFNWVWCVVPLLFLNGASQYLGLKTETCFTMYSNLRTEGGRNNHLFMPALRLTPHQDELIEIIATDHPQLQPFIERRQYIVRFELRRILSEYPGDVEVTYRYQGQLQKVTRQRGVSSDPSLTTRHPLILAKLLYFRPVYMGPKALHQH
ncbi:MAG: hypothetical protein CL681_09825 [Blastopirellula sp.]|nr:hypothetical protein [Blastopirellula sp.]